MWPSNGGADFQWTVNMLAQSVTKWNTAGDQRLERLISSNTKERCRQDCFVEKKTEDCILGWFQDASFAADLQDSKSTSGGVLCRYLNREHLSQFSGMCQRQTAVSQSRAESEIISLDAGLTRECIPASQLWNCVFETFSHSCCSFVI